MDHDNLLSPEMVENDLNYDFVRKLSNADSSNLNFDNPFYEINFDSRYFEELEFCKKYRNNDNLSLITWNIQSLNSKFEGLLEFISNLNNFNINLDVLCFQEIFEISNPDFFHLDNYDFYFKTRRGGKKGGGVGIYSKKSLKGKLIEDLCIFEENLFESITVEIEINTNKKALITNIYRPPTNINSNLTPEQQLEKFIDIYGNLQAKLSLLNKNSYILADFNIDILKFQDHNKTNDFLECNFANGYLPMISKPTRFGHTNASCIDNIFINNISNSYTSGVILNPISDHYPCFIFSESCKPKNNPKYVTFREFNQEKFDQFSEILNSQSWEDVISINNTQTSFDNFMNFYTETFNSVFPLKKVRFNKKIHKKEPFMTNGLLKSRFKKLKLAAKYSKSKTVLNTTRYKQYRDIYNSLIKLSKKMYFKDIILENKSDLKKQWQILREALRKTNDKSSTINEIKYEGLTFSNHKDIAAQFNKHFTTIANKIEENINPSFSDPCEFLNESNSLFNLGQIYPKDVIDVVKAMDPKNSTDMFGISNSILKKIINFIAVPLCHIINRSFLTGVIPVQLKIAKVLPICKLKPSDAGDKSLPTNYRPISLLPIFSKILEKIVANKLNDFLLENEILFKHQYGFQAKKSTLHPIMHLLNELALAKNNNKVSIGVFCDISKGFDTISHDILLKKLEKIGVRNKELDWFKNYLNQRRQFVVIGDETSEYLEITKGVPQGSILGPILFLIYINDLPRATDLFTMLFADDTSFVVSGNNLNDIITKLNNELKKINNWFRANKLCLNAEKTKIMIFNKREDTIDWEDINVFIDSNNDNENNPELINKIGVVNGRSKVPAIKFLGVFIDSNLSFKYHIDFIRKKVSSSLYMINRAKNILCKKSLTTLYHSFIHSHLLYCLPIWSSCPKSYLEPLIKLQKKAIRIITGTKYNSHTADKFTKLNIMPLPQLADYSKLLFMYDYINDKLPLSFQETWKRKNEVYNNIRNNRRMDGDHFYIPIIRFKSIEKLPYFCFPDLWNKNCFNDLLNSYQPRKMFIKNLTAYLMIQVETVCTKAVCNECFPDNHI